MTNKEILKEYTKSNLRDCQLKQLSILEEVDRICNKHQIEYWLDGGTLLGAVRHGGFIPWDDDIDIAMTMDGLKRFCEVAPQELPKHLFLQTKESDPTAKEPITKIRDLNSLYLEGADILNAPYHKGVFIDIFPFIPCPAMPKGFLKKLTKGIVKSYSILHKPHYYSLRAVAEWCWFTARYYGSMAIWNTWSLLADESKYMSNIPINNGCGMSHLRSTIFPIGTITFEGKTFPAPHDVDAYLKDQYKNYMEIPPVDKRQIHAMVMIPQLTDTVEV